jgi:hypothetical protein
VVATVYSKRQVLLISIQVDKARQTINSTLRVKVKKSLVQKFREVENQKAVNTKMIQKWRLKMRVKKKAERMKRKNNVNGMKIVMCVASKAK